MDDRALWNQQQQDLERQKLVSVMAAGIHSLIGSCLYPVCGLYVKSA